MDPWLVDGQRIRPRQAGTAFLEAQPDLDRGAVGQRVDPNQQSIVVPAQSNGDANRSDVERRCRGESLQRCGLFPARIIRGVGTPNHDATEPR